jgi:hypothetical protein
MGGELFNDPYNGDWLQAEPAHNINDIRIDRAIKQRTPSTAENKSLDNDSMKSDQALNNSFNNHRYSFTAENGEPSSNQ